MTTHQGGNEAMPGCHDSSERQVRSIFVSDTHLGCKHARADALLDFLRNHRADTLYLVGDIIDGWALRRKWHWRPIYDAIIQRLLEMRAEGTRLRYAPGNHDAFLRQYLIDMGVVEVADQFIHTTPAGQRFLVLHGDRFDKFEQYATWFTMMTAATYNVMLSMDYWLHRLTFRRTQRNVVCGVVKTKAKKLVMHYSEFERQLIENAEKHECHGVICGHIHNPKISELAGITYVNTGDWLENCTGLVEREDGVLEIVNADGSVRQASQPWGPMSVEGEFNGDEPQREVAEEDVDVSEPAEVAVA
ncbi:MAG: UDP-2,3-diacylglucosamine diphosphatase [Planctomycetota bacterium]|nr:MAG: UDP-2,3-diacylglucosamine diphosphatase [Planctomycetota bacterium]